VLAESASVSRETYPHARVAERASKQFQELFRRRITTTDPVIKSALIEVLGAIHLDFPKLEGTYIPT
jgi:hypothetical protein